MRLTTDELDVLDRFAAAALSGLIAASRNKNTVAHRTKETAEVSYEYAKEAVLRRREIRREAAMDPEPR